MSLLVKYCLDSPQWSPFCDVCAHSRAHLEHGLSVYLSLSFNLQSNYIYIPPPTTTTLKVNDLFTGLCPLPD